MEEEIDKYVSYYSFPCEMLTGFEYYRAFSQMQKTTKNQQQKENLQCQVLSGDIYPALGRDFPEV